MPEIITYISDINRIKLAIDAGATHLVLEDSKVCIRSYSDDFGRPDFGKLIDLAIEALKLKPTIILSANCDILMHEYHIPRVIEFLKTLVQIGIQNVRVQDIGVAMLAKEINPNFHIALNSEIGNHNPDAIAFHARLFDRQVLGNELPLPILQTITNTINTQFDLQVHGPILIQYSNRRYLGSLAKKHSQNNEWDLDSAPTFSQLAIQDEEYQGRYFPVLDNPHGHLMFFYMDRCLYHHLDAISKLNLAGWIVDARGQSDDYLLAALHTFSAANTELNSPLERGTATAGGCGSPSQKGWQAQPDGVVRMTERSDGEGWTPSPTQFQHLQSTSPRPLKPGFFVANKTDQDRKSEAQDDVVGIVLDCIKETSITIEILAVLDPDTSLFIETPEGRKIPVPSPSWKDMHDTPIRTSLKRHQLVLLPWVKHAVPKSVVKVLVEK